MSKRLDPSWVVVNSLENDQHDRCVDVFARADGSFGFEEFRRDPEDAGAWTPVSFFSGLSYVSEAETLDQASERVAWLGLQSGTRKHLSTDIGIGDATSERGILGQIRWTRSGRPDPADN